MEKPGTLEHMCLAGTGKFHLRTKTARKLSPEREAPFGSRIRRGQSFNQGARGVAETVRRSDIQNGFMRFPKTRGGLLQHRMEELL